MKKGYWIIVICMLLAIGCNGSEKAGKQVGQSDEVSQDANQNGDEAKQEEESKQFCRQFPVEGLLAIIDRPASAEEYGLSLIYEIETEDEEGGCSYSETIYGKDIEKIDKEDNAYELKSTSGHSCFVRVTIATCESYSINFSNEEDANNFFEKISNYGVIEDDNYLIIPEEKLPKGKPVSKDSIEDFHPLYSVCPPVLEEGFYQISLDRFM